MGARKFTIPHGDIWRRPDEAYFDYQDMAKNIGADEVEWNGRHKSIRELRDLAVFGLSMYGLDHHPQFVQMNPIDPSPDAFVLRVAGKSTEPRALLRPIELTYYGSNRNGRPQETLLERLVKRGGKFQKLPNR